MSRDLIENGGRLATPDLGGELGLPGCFVQVFVVRQALQAQAFACHVVQKQIADTLASAAGVRASAAFH